MPSPESAEAFLQKCLRDPTDVTTRLALADWLEQTGQPANVAWAHYIRLSAEIADCPPGDRRETLLAETQNHAPRIRAKLTVPAAVFVKHHESLQQLLPLDRFSVRLDGFKPNREAVRLLNAPIARVYKAFPIEHTGSALLLAVADQDSDSISSDLSEFLGLPVLAVRGSPEDIARAISTHYLRTMTNVQ
jgi:uncharacterized protein (TIGR02996 family)